MRIALITIGYNLPGATTRLLDSARQGCCHELVSLLILHSRMPDKVREMETLANRPDVVYRDYGVNRGLAKSWNEGILWGYEQGFDVVLVVNEDVTLGAGDTRRLAELAVQRRASHLITGRAYHHSEKAWSSSEYGCFAINPIALSTLGCFDENFFPIYCEDSDYRRRARLAGLCPALCEGTAIVHGGSQSLSQPQVARQNSVTYVRNRHYYQRKWGGEGGGEQYGRPFDDPRFTWFIDPRLRSGPYPGFDRTDQSLVQL